MFSGDVAAKDDGSFRFAVPSARGPDGSGASARLRPRQRSAAGLSTRDVSEQPSFLRS